MSILRRRGVPGSRCATVAFVAVFAAAACSSTPVASSVDLQPSASLGPSAAASGATEASPAVRASDLPRATTEMPLPLFGALPAADLDATSTTALQAALDAAVAAGATDAIGAVVTADGQWAGAAGIGGPNERLATPKDEFAIANVSKLFTATLIMRLAEQGKVDLDAPLAMYLGDLRVDANGATVRQALGMMAGLADDEQPAAADAIHIDAAHVWTPDELVARYLPPVAHPGTRYSRSSPGYALLGYAAEHATGMSFPAVMRAEMLDPVGATRILAQGPDAATPKPWALPIETNLGTWRPEDMGVGGAISCISSATYGPGAGSMASDAPSLAAWAWHLFAGDIVSEPSLRLMVPSPGSPHALGLEEITGLGGYRAVGLTGSKTGYSSILAVFPAEQVVVVVFVNEADYIVEPVALSLFEAARPA